MIDLGPAALAELAIKSTLLPVAALLLTLGLRRRTAAERHVVWSAVVVALLAMPVAQALLPGIDILPRLDVRPRCGFRRCAKGRLRRPRPRGARGPRSGQQR